MKNSLIALLDVKPFDHTIYLALADIALEEGDEPGSLVWRAFYRYRAFPHKENIGPDRGKYWWWFDVDMDEWANSANPPRKWDMSLDDTPYVCLTEEQHYAYHHDATAKFRFDKPSEAIVHLKEFIEMNPSLFERELYGRE